MYTIEKKSVNAGKFASKHEVDNFIRTYKQERWADNSDRMGKADSLSVWFTVEEVEAFLESVKANGGNGVRFHFGVFTEENATQPEFVGRQTLVMVGNRSSDGSAETSKQLFSFQSGQPEIVAYSGGIVCPPVCGSGTTPPSSAYQGSVMGSATLIDRGENGMSVI